MSFAASLKHFSLRMLPSSLLLPLRKAHYARKLRRNLEEPEMAFIPHLLPDGGCAIDLGANFGLYTHFLAKTVGRRGTVHAVEPVPGTFNMLKHNVRQQRLAHVRVHHCALSDRNEQVAMVIPNYEQGGENLYEARVVSPIESEYQRTVRVSGRTMDSLFGHLGRIDFVKCDVEGHELAVLNGASGILNVHRPAWMIEVSGNPDVADSSAAQVVEIMTRAGYRMYYLDNADMQRTSNCFFLRPEHVRQLHTIGE